MHHVAQVRDVHFFTIYDFNALLLLVWQTPESSAQRAMAVLLLSDEPLIRVGLGEVFNVLMDVKFAGEVKNWPRVFKFEFRHGAFLPETDSVRRYPMRSADALSASRITMTLLVAMM